MFVGKQLLNKNGGIAHDAMRYVDVHILFIYNLYTSYYFIDSNVLFIYNYTFLDNTIYILIFLLAFRVYGSNDYSSNRAMKFGTKQIAVHLGH